MTQVERLQTQRNLLDLLDLQMRTLLNSLVCEDTLIGVQQYVADEIALHLNESPGTATRLVDSARIFCDYPAVMAHTVTQNWSMRHADALLDEITGLGLTRDQQDQIVDLVASHEQARTPHQLRKATRAAVITIDPAAAARRYDTIKKNRSVGVSETVQGGATFWADGTKSQIAMVMASIDALVGPAQPGETRTLAQRRFDVLMDLICGRTVPGPFQAYVVVALATLEGEPVPAEIPGLGLITAEEAREILAQADLRRVVVDENGEIISIDTHLQHPDQAHSAQAPAQGERLLSNQTEPPVCDLLEDEPSEADLAWYHAPQAAQATAAAGQADEAAPTAADAAACANDSADGSAFERALAQLLNSYTLTPATGVRTPDLSVVRHAEAPGRDDPGGGPPHPGGSPPPAAPGGSPPHDPNDDPHTLHYPDPPPDPTEHEPEPEPPSVDDQQWLDETLHHATFDHPLPQPRAQKEPRVRGTTPAPRPAWTRTGLQHALTRLLTAEVDRRPLSSTAYTLPPRMARFVKLRDATCTFPGCYKLTQHCQNDHVVAWPMGPTAPHNVASECTHHHQAKHAHFRVTRDQVTGTVSWTTPSGKTVHRGPRPLLRGW